MKKEWKIFNVSGQTAEIFLYGIIGRYYDIDVNSLVQKLEGLKNQGITNLIFYVNSDGGEVIQGIALFQYLERAGFNVTWRIDGMAASMAAMIMFHRGSTIEPARYSKAMLHRVSGMVGGNADDLRQFAEQLDTWEESLIDILAERTKLTKEDVKNRWFDGKDHWLSAQDMLMLGLANSIFEGRPDIEPAPENLTSLEVYNYYERIINLKEETDMKNPSRFVAVLASLPSLKAIENADEDSVFAAVQNVVNRCIKAETDIQAKDIEIANLQKQINDSKDADIKNMVDQAIKERKFGDDMRATYTNMAKHDLEGTRKIIASLNGVIDITSQLGKKTDDKRKDWTWEDYSKKDPKSLNAMKTENPDQFKALYKAQYGKEPIV